MSTATGNVLKRVFGGTSGIDMNTLRGWNIAAAGILGVQSLALLVMSSSYTVPVYWLFMTEDSLQSRLQGTPVVAPAVHELTQVNLAYLLAAMLGLLALGYVLLATVWREWYEASLKRSWQPLRWVLVAIGLSGALAVLSLLVGLRSVADLKAQVVLVVIASLAGAQLELRFSERRHRVTLRDRLVLVIGIVAAVAAWLLLIVTALGGVVYGSAPVPSYIWWLVGSLFAGCWLYVISLHLSLARYGKWASYAHGELCVSVLLVAVETAVAWQVFGAVLRP